MIFLITKNILTIEGSIATGTFIWVIIWWMTQVVPYAITSLLPLIVFPLTNMSTLEETLVLYAQPVFFWIASIVLLGYAFQKYELTDSLVRIVKRNKFFLKSAKHLAFGYLASVYLISTVISDTAVIGIMLPVGISLVNLINNKGISEIESQNVKSSFRKAIVLGTLFSAISGGMATIMGTPHNVIALSIIDKYTTVSFIDWFKIGFPISLFMLLINFVLMWNLFLKQISNVPLNIHEEEKQKSTNNTNRFRGGKRATLAIFLFMIALWIIAPKNISLWEVPIIGLILLFTIPVDLKEKKFVLEWKELLDNGQWNVAMLATGGAVLGNALSEYGVFNTILKALPLYGLSVYFIIGLAFLVMIALTNNFSGTAATLIIVQSLIPVIVEKGYNPFIFGLSISILGIGVMFPWSGAAAGTTFAMSGLAIKDMFKYGLMGTALLLITVLLLNGLYIAVYL
ncbi:SLC13 family permease [Oxobacter pfennigii]|nr:SLC13 family permease [Oxobacter pfennigii]